MREATGGNGADVAMNVAGGQTVTATVSATKLGGLVHLIGFVSGPIAEVDLFEAIRQGTTFQTATAGSREDLEAFIHVSELNKFRPAIAKVLELKDLGAAIDAVDKGGQLGKVVLKLNF